MVARLLMMGSSRVVMVMVVVMVVVVVMMIVVELALQINSHGTQLSNSENTLFCQYQACRNYTM